MTRSTLKHLRFKQSLFLSPVILFALIGEGQISLKTWGLYALLLFFIFPASNAYNSYYDRDEGSIGGLEHPPVVTEDLLYWSLGLEFFSLTLISFFESWHITLLLFTYGIVSKLYSHPTIRWKARPWPSTFSVSIFQGAVIFFVMKISLGKIIDDRDLLGAVISTLLIAAAYPLTQIYQHEEDKGRGDRTLSLVLGIRGTFLFSLLILLLAEILMSLYFANWPFMLVLLACNLPAIYFLLKWSLESWRNETHASFQNTHNFLGRLTLGSHIGFAILLVWPT